MRILGISAFYHDSAACLLADGAIVAAAQEERFTRRKHDASFPHRAVEYCLSEGGLGADQLDLVAYYDKPLLSFERLLETYLAFAPDGLPSFSKALNLWLTKKLFIRREINRGLNDRYGGKILYARHHLSHAASAFYPSPFSEAAILTADGVGEWATTTIGCGSGSKIELLKELEFPHSLGLLYSAFTYYLGFKVNSGEYKVMGLAPYGRPRYLELIFSHLLDLKEDGSFWMDMRYFDYCQGLRMTSRRFEELFGFPPRKPEGGFAAEHFDLAASIQKATEMVMLKLALHAKHETGAENLCLAGGVSLNCVANSVIRDAKLFKRVWVQPAAGDAGGALGAALLAWHQYLAQPRTINPHDAQKGSLLGPAFRNEEIKEYLDGVHAVYTFAGDNELVRTVAQLLSIGKVVGFFCGRMEYGPRALGARSILADPRVADMQSRLNLKIKFRESFRPFAPSVLQEHAPEYFNSGTESPYMLFTEYVADDKRLPIPPGSSDLIGLDLLKAGRSVIPAVTHVDFSARLQTVTKERNGIFYDLLQAFHKLTGCPALINTSFNIRGEPIVCTPADAYRCFMFTDMDTLVLENYILLKEQQPALPGATEYRRKASLD